MWFRYSKDFSLLGMNVHKLTDSGCLSGTLGPPPPSPLRAGSPCRASGCACHMLPLMLAPPPNSNLQAIAVHDLLRVSLSNTLARLKPNPRPHPSTCPRGGVVRTHSRCLTLAWVGRTSSYGLVWCGVWRGVVYPCARATAVRCVH